MSRKKGKEEYPEMPDMVEIAPDYGMMPGCGPGMGPIIGPGMMPGCGPGMGPGMMPGCGQGMGMYCFCVPFPMNPCDHHGMMPGMMPGMLPDYSMIPIYDYEDDYSHYPIMADDDD